MTDFAFKLAKVGAKLVQVGPSWHKVGLKLEQRCRQDDPKPVKSVATHNGNPPGSQRGATEDYTFGISCPQEPSKKINRNKHRHRQRPKRHGTRDDDRI